jgi:diguanylate cyclase (GGDEF)-like protein
MLAAFGLVVALMVGIGLIAVTRLASDNQQLANLASKVVPSTRAVGDINALVNKHRKDQLVYVYSKTAERVPNNLGPDQALMDSYLTGYRSRGLVQSAADRRLLDSFQASYARYVHLSAGFKALADSGHIVRASEAISGGPADAENDKLNALLAGWSDLKAKTARAAERASKSSYDLSVALILSLLAVALAVAITVALVLSRRTTRALREVAGAAKAISRGDIDQRVVVRSRDEFGDMATDFDSMIDYLRDNVAVAETIAAGDLDVEVRLRSEEDALGKALLGMTSSLRSLIGENKRLLAASHEEANTDALTALPNRRALTHELETALANASEQDPLMLALFDLNGFKLYNDSFGHAAGDALLSRVGERLQRVLDGTGTAYRMGGDEFCVLAAAGANRGAAIARQAADALSERGEAFTISCCFGIVDLPAEASAPSDALRLADQRMYAGKTGRVAASRQTTDVLLTALNEQSPELCEHVSEVSQLSATLAARMGLPEAEVKRIELAAELHDIGKVAIPETILNKPGPLDEEEWEYVRRHTQIGERIVTAAPSLAHTANLVRSHHERYDGSGYPDRLAGDAIPLGASVIAVCDAFGAMTKTRPYTDAIKVTDALNELRRCAGTHFHPDVVRAFCDLLEQPAGPNDPEEVEEPRKHGAFSTATGIRTRVSAMRGRRPSPLDDSGAT